MARAMPSMYEPLAVWFHLLTPPSDDAEEAAELLGLLQTYSSPPLDRAQARPREGSQ